MWETVLGIYSKNKITLPNGNFIKACPYEHDMKIIEDQKGFFLLKSFEDTELMKYDNLFIIINYILISDDLYDYFKKN